MSQSRKRRRNQGKAKKELLKKQQLEKQAQKKKNARRLVVIKGFFGKVADFFKQHLTIHLSKKNIIIFSVFFVLVLGITIYHACHLQYEDTTSKEPQIGEEVVSGIYDSTEVKQYFVLDSYLARLESIEILFATHNDTIKTEGVVFTLYNEKGKEMYSQEITQGELADNKYYEVKLPEKYSCGNEKWYYVLRGKDRPHSGKKAPAVWLSNYGGASKELYVNGKVKEALQANTIYHYEEKDINAFLLLIVLIFLGAAMCFLRFSVGEGKLIPWVCSILILISNIALVEWMVKGLGEAEVIYGVPLRILNYVLILALILIMGAITGNLLVTIGIIDVLLLVFSIANYFVMNYRGYPIVPSDLLSVGTLETVVSNYKLRFTTDQTNIIIGFLLFLILCLWLHRNQLLWNAKGQRKTRRYLIASIISVVIGAATVGILSSPKVLSKAGTIVTHWQRQNNYYNNGLLMNFMVHLQYTFIQKPDGYSDDAAREILAEYTQEGQDQQDQETDLRPNVIMIMNESLADYSLWDGNQLTFNQDPLPFLHSLSDNTIKGKCYVSIFGAGTANSELEALTGHTMAFFPAGSVVYQLFPQKETKGTVADFKAAGYSCTAMHPFPPGNWTRDKVYASMGFDEFISYDDFKGSEKVRFYSDKATYEKIIQVYEEKEKDKPMFLFDVTMQGHGGYTNNTKWEEPIKVNGENLPQTKEYLSSTHVSDQAFEYLVEYFKKQEEPTIICMFGDHQPSLNDGFYDKIDGVFKQESGLAEAQKKYITPYVLWANYDIEEASKDISANQLGTMVKETAGITLSSYDRFLKAFSEEIPLINANGFQSKDGRWHSFEEETSYDEWLHKYKILQYYMYCRAEAHK